MRRYDLVRTQVVPVPVEQAFAFFADARNLEAITPAWLRFRIVDAPDELERGALLRYELRLYGVPIRWLTEITGWTPPRGFTDTQVRGPYLEWVHAHRLAPVAEGTEIHDHVRYRLPGGPLAPLAQRLLVGRWLDAIFAHRAAQVARLLASPLPNG